MSFPLEDPAVGLNTPWPEIPALLLPAYAETWAMVGIVMAITIIVGGAIGVVLFNASPRGLFPNASLYGVLSWIVNIGRSLPFLVLMAAIIPFTRLITGTTIGIAAAVVPMAIAGIPFFARLIENALRDLPSDVMSVGVVSGGSLGQVIRTTQVGEALPTIVGAVTINVISMIEYSAIAGTIGAGGIGYLAVTYGYQRFDTNVMIATIIALIVTAQLVQFVGNRIAAALTRA